MTDDYVVVVGNVLICKLSRTNYVAFVREGGVNVKSQTLPIYRYLEW